MSHQRQHYLLFFLLIWLNSLTGCESRDTSNDSAADSDSVALFTADSVALDSVQEVSTINGFQRVLDSVYQKSPQKVLTSLNKGYARFLGDSAFINASKEVIPDSLARRRPYLVLTDIDLPLAPERIFDLRKSMFMQLSSPACLVDPRQVAVMEYAVQYSGTQVILILANSNSRIVGAACDNVQTGSFGTITTELAKAMKTSQEFADRSSANKEFVNSIAKSQADLTLQQILKQSPQIKMLADSGKLILRTAFYDGAKRALTISGQNASLNSLTKK